MFEHHAPEDMQVATPRTDWSIRGAEYFAMTCSREFVAAVALIALMIVFRLVNIMTAKFDTDESQHLHVVWGWARGFVQYRDLCDNHMPLFQMLFAPIYALIGDRPTILFWMRFTILPIYFVTAWATYRIGALLFSRRVGLWAAILVDLFPDYQYTSLEFRTDNLWAPLWLLCILVLVKGPLTVRRAVAAGLLIGCCFGISMKTAILFLSLVIGAALSFLLLGRRYRAVSLAHILRCCAAFFFCALAVPAIIMAGFALAGIWPQFRYWVFENNILPGLKNHATWWTYLFPVLFPIVVGVVAYFIRRIPDSTVAFRRGFIFLTCGFYMPALWSYWSLVTRQDYLPFHPLGFVIYTGVILAVADRVLHEGSILSQLFRRVPLPAVIAVVEFLVCLARPFWMNNARIETDLLRATYRLTEPGDFVLDEKGETVFRQRAFGPIWEPFVMERIRRGLIIDNAAQRCIETHTCVATKGKDMSIDATRFIEQNFLPVGSGLYVVGAFLKAAPNDAKHFDFVVVIPAPYEIISPAAPVSGILDQSPYTGARLLSPGRHTFVETSDQPQLAFLWAQAAERKFTPFR